MIQNPQHHNPSHSKRNAKLEEGRVEWVDVQMALQRAKSSQTRSITTRRKQGSLDIKNGREKINDDDSMTDYRDVNPFNVKQSGGVT